MSLFAVPDAHTMAVLAVVRKARYGITLAEVVRSTGLSCHDTVRAIDALRDAATITQTGYQLHVAQPK